MTRAKYEAFIASIDNSVALTATGCTLAECIDDSARTNASDTMVERGHDPRAVDQPEFWVLALDNAKMILDDWRSFYPEMRR